MSRGTRAIAVAACCLALSSVAGRTRADEPLKQRLLAEAPARWAELQRASERAAGTYTQTVIRGYGSTIPLISIARWAELDRSSGRVTGDFTKRLFLDAESQPPPITHRAFAINGARMKVATEFVEKPGGKPEMFRVEAINPGYIFQINRRPTSPKHEISYVMANGEKGDPVLLKKVAGIVVGYKADIFCSWVFLGRPLSVWLNDPGMKIVGVDLIEAEDRKVARVQFDYASASDPADKLSDAHIDLDVEGHWTIRGYAARRPWGTIEAKLTYGDPIDGIPVVKSKKEILKGRDSKVIRTLEMENFSRKDVPPGEFTLTAYDLPEPNFD